MTEHAAVIFVFFFLAEYASIVLICVLTTILFLGGYLYNCLPYFFFTLLEYVNFDFYSNYLVNKEILFSNPIIEGFIYGFSLGLKSSIMIFIFI
jgi:NADH-ubiquinone oxidoreductase chain 1